MNKPLSIERLSTQRAKELKADLINILQDTVNNDSSVGFLRPLSSGVADQYWSGVINTLEMHRILLVALEDDHVVGTVQAELCSKQNGRHRAEVQKLMVLTSHRRKSIARKLMSQIEQATQEAGCSLLFLDTVTGKPAEQVYLQLDWTRSGSIPNYAVSPDGKMESTTIFYKLLYNPSQLAAW